MLRICFFLLLMLSLLGETDARSAFVERYNVSYLNIGHGLPSNYIDDIYEDQRGFIWVSTHGGGLVRYDGYTFLNFGVGHADTPFKSSYCHNTTEDNMRRLWISFDEYTGVLDLSTMRPVVPACATTALATKLKSVLGERSMRVYTDRSGRVWIATRRNLYAVGFDGSGKVNAIWQRPCRGGAPDVPLKEVEGIGMLTYDDGRLLCFRLPAHQSGISQLKEAALPKTMTYPRNVFVTDMRYHGGRLWLATNQGLFASGATPIIYRHTAEANSLAHDFVTSLAETADGHLLVGTLAGMDIMENGRFEHCSMVGPAGETGTNFVNCLLSAHGMVWVGTESGGMVKLSPRQLTIRNYTHTTSTGSISANAVNAIYASADGTLWVGTVEGGLNRMAPGTTDFVHYTTRNTRLSHNSVSAFAADGAGTLWVGTWGGGVNRMNLANPAGLAPISVADPRYAAPLSFVGALAYDPYNRALWIGTNDGIFYQDLATGTIREPFAGCRDIHGCIGSLVDRTGTLWMGCLDGVVKIDLRHPKHGRFAHQQLRYKLDDPRSGVIDKITCFCQTADGTIWLGSSGYGLYRREVDSKGSERFRSFTVAGGLANNSVKGIAQDKLGRLWVATDHGLSLLCPKTENFTNFGEEDGLQSSQFYFNGAVTAPDGRLLLGTAKGLTIIEATDSLRPQSGRLSFTQLQVNGQTVWGGSKYIDEDISMAREINVGEGDKSFSIAFSALNFMGERHGQYLCRMMGYEDRWTQLQAGEHAVCYTSLPPGHYTFVVRYMSGSGNGHMEEARINVVVTPYFYKSWWFVVICLLAAAGVAVWAYRRRMAMMRRQERERILEPIERALSESDTPQLLQKRIEAIMDNQRRYTQSKEKAIESDREDVGRNQADFVERVVSIMEQNYANADFGVSELSEAMHISRSVLSKRLNAEMGMPPTQFIRNYRLEIAKKLIEENLADRNITEVAYRVGFNDPKYFSRCFAKLYGVSPSAYRPEK